MSPLLPLVVLIALALAAAGSTTPDTRLPTAQTLPGGRPAPSCGPVAPGAPGIAAGGGIQYLGAARLGRELDGLQALGARWIRFDIAWSDVQQDGRDRYDWGRYDAVIREAVTRHLEVVGMIGYSPPWATAPGATSDKFPPRDPADYARFAAVVARRYAPMGVHTWEVWNEPNNPDFWMPAPRVSEYATMLKQAYLAIKAADPAATVLSGGLAAESTTSTSISPIDFLRALYADGAGGSFDAVATHPYSFPALPLDYHPGSAWSQMNRTTPSLRGVMESNSDSSKRIWATEYGAPTDDGGVTDAQQAAMISQAFSVFRSQPWAGPLFVYSYRDARGSDSGGDFFGLLRTDSSRKPSWQAFRSAARAIGAGC